jgi:hypothetical protein
MPLDPSALHAGSLWTHRIREGRLEAREAGADWVDVGEPGDVRALHEFYGAPLPPPDRWMPWHPIRDWWLKRRAKRVYARWYETKHRVELEEKRKTRLAQLNLQAKTGRRM